MAERLSLSTPVAGVNVSTRRYEVGFEVPGDTASALVVTICWPQSPSTQRVWFCLPGGAMNRHFFDLQGQDGRFSFAVQMAKRGYVSVLVDPPGIGESERPANGHDLTLARLTGALCRLREAVVGDLRSGAIDAGLPAMDNVQTIGLGHSMGAMLTVLQQAARQQHMALALLGFGLQGVPDYVQEQIQGLDAGTIRRRVPELARQIFPQSYPEIASGGGRGDFYGSSAAERDAVVALKAARDQLLPQPAFLSMVPGNVATEAAGIDVPMYLAYGEADFIGPADDGACGFVASPAVQQQMLPATGHSFFLFESRRLLFDGLADWAANI